MNTVQESQSSWLEKVRTQKVLLREFIENWHPAKPAKESLKITAPNAEVACENVRMSIRNEQKEDPLVVWDKAVEIGDVDALMNLLSAAWFGVPESTECWNIKGFREAVDLLDDPPEAA